MRFFIFLYSLITNRGIFQYSYNGNRLNGNFYDLYNLIKMESLKHNNFDSLIKHNYCEVYFGDGEVEWDVDVDDDGEFIHNQTEVNDNKTKNEYNIENILSTLFL